MSTLHATPIEAASLRDEMKCYGISIAQTTAWRLLRRVGDRSLCVDAMLMKRRPAWLSELLNEKPSQN